MMPNKNQGVGYLQRLFPRSARCELCGSQGPLKLSHVIPKLVGRAIKEFEGSKTFRDSYTPNLPVQDTLKVHMLCGPCEGRLNRWETPTANSVVRPLLFEDRRLVEYGAWLLPFAISVLWRSLIVQRRISIDVDPTRAIPARLLPSIDRAIDGWRSWLQQQDPSNAPLTQRVFMYAIDAAHGDLASLLQGFLPAGNLRTLIALPPTIRSQGSLFVGAHLGPIFLLAELDAGGLFNAEEVGRTGVMKRQFIYPRVVRDLIRFGLDKLAVGSEHLSDDRLTEILLEGDKASGLPGEPITPERLAVARANIKANGRRLRLPSSAFASELLDR